MPIGMANVAPGDPLTFLGRRMASLERLVRELTASNTLANIATQSALSSVASSVVSLEILPANANRRGAVLVNDSTAVLYIAYAATASATAYTVKLAAGGQHFMDVPVYTGAVSGIWAAANGACRVTDLSA